MKNLRNQSIFACLFLLVLVPLSAEAVPPPSPAGGNYLVLDGVDDHAILDFETFGLLMPKGTDFTFEAWIYPTTLPDKNVNAIILSQQVRMHVWDHDHNNLKLMGGAHVALGAAHVLIAFGHIKFPPNQWHHIAFQGGKEQNTTIIVNDDVRALGRQKIILADDISHAGHPQAFTIGGFGENIEFHAGHFWGHFSGYIDEVRISKVARYNTAKRGFTPREKFKNDAKTVALWHFDEARGVQKFLDTSGNAYHLMGKNGAKTDGEFAAVEAEGKLATLWGRLKQ
ncbi:hypothetical protein C6503_25290 [Candidatus Poribacteria bacterium]|nr:MAG: hypothetical protein C6503_25290 [Candidatus Poribacteria bacterium]